MSSVQSIGSADVRTAIAVAAKSTGVDFDYLLAQARLESSLDPSARAASSSAAGLYQFTGGTWLATLDRHGTNHGLDWAEAAIEGGRISDPAMRSQIMALRYDPQVSALMAGELANDNRGVLTAVLGRAPDSTELYLAHFLGADGATRFLQAHARDPGQVAANIVPRAAAANRTIFNDSHGAPRSLDGVLDLLRTRLAAAMEGAPPPAFGESYELAMRAPASAPVFGGLVSGGPVSGGPVAREFHAAAQAGFTPEAPTHPARASMADTLRATFGLVDGGEGTAPDHVRAAYGRLQAFGM